MPCRYALRQLSPLLGSAVGLQDGSSMQVTVKAFKSHLPAEQYTVRVQPMRLVMGSSGFLSGIMTLLNLRSVTAQFQVSHCSSSGQSLPVQCTSPVACSKQLFLGMRRRHGLGEGPSGRRSGKEGDGAEQAVLRCSRIQASVRASLVIMAGEMLMGNGQRQEEGLKQGKEWRS